MAKTLTEYVEWLHERSDLRWPSPPAPVPVKATPYLKPLPGIRAVTWSVYGTLLRIPHGELLHISPDELPMQIALEKTIQEFNMWNSMTRKPGAPWESLLEPYRRFVEDDRLRATRRKGDVPEVDSAGVWKRVIGRLVQKEYKYDVAVCGDHDQLSQKMAYFFHASQQGVEATDRAAATLQAISEAGLRQSLLSDGQCFTFVQLLLAVSQQSTLPPPGQLFASECMTLSYQEEVRKPSEALYAAAVERFDRLGILPDQILHVGSRVREDLAKAKAAGMRTVL